MKRVIKVNANETEVVRLDAPNTVLTTGGVSTCICLLAEGDVEGIPYRAMYHWDGFDCSFNRQASNADQQADRIVDGLIRGISGDILKRFRADNERGVRPHLHALYLIGGERAAEGLSGTEHEVEALQRNAEKQCAKYFITSAKTTYDRRHYQTSGAQSLRIVFDASGVQVTSNEGYDSDEEYGGDKDPITDSFLVASYAPPSPR